MFIDYVQILRNKAQKEYDDLIEKLKNIPSSGAINYAYEKVIKEDILICILNESIDNTKAKALSFKSYPLDYCYIEWLKNDYSNMELVSETIDSAMQKATKERQKDERESR